MEPVNYLILEKKEIYNPHSFKQEKEFTEYMVQFLVPGLIINNTKCILVTSNEIVRLTSLHNWYFIPNAEEIKLN